MRIVIACILAFVVGSSSANAAISEDVQQFILDHLKLAVPIEEAPQPPVSLREKAKTIADDLQKIFECERRGCLGKAITYGGEKNSIPEQYKELFAQKLQLTPRDKGGASEPDGRAVPGIIIAFIGACTWDAADCDGVYINSAHRNKSGVGSRRHTNDFATRAFDLLGFKDIDHQIRFLTRMVLVIEEMGLEPNLGLGLSTGEDEEGRAIAYQVTHIDVNGHEVSRKSRCKTICSKCSKVKGKRKCTCKRQCTSREGSHTWDYGPRTALQIMLQEKIAAGRLPVQFADSVLVTRTLTSKSLEHEESKDALADAQATSPVSSQGKTPAQLKYNLWGIEFKNWSPGLDTVYGRQLCKKGGPVPNKENVFFCAFDNPIDAMTAYFLKIDAYCRSGICTPLTIARDWVGMGDMDAYGKNAAIIIKVGPTEDIDNLIKRVLLMQAQACLEQGFCVYSEGKPKVVEHLITAFPFSRNEIFAAIIRAHSEKVANEWFASTVPPVGLFAPEEPTLAPMTPLTYNAHYEPDGRLVVPGVRADYSLYKQGEAKSQKDTLTIIHGDVSFNCKEIQSHYHACISRNGVFKQFRPFSARAPHAAYMNSYTTGIVLPGIDNLPPAHSALLPPTLEQLETLARVLFARDVAEGRRIPFARHPNTEQGKGHKCSCEAGTPESDVWLEQRIQQLHTENNTNLELRKETLLNLRGSTGGIVTRSTSQLLQSVDGGVLVTDPRGLVPGAQAFYPAEEISPPVLATIAVVNVARPALYGIDATLLRDPTFRYLVVHEAHSTATEASMLRALDTGVYEPNIDCARLFSGCAMFGYHAFLPKKGRRILWMAPRGARVNGMQPPGSIPRMNGVAENAANTNALHVVREGDSSEPLTATQQSTLKALSEAFAIEPSHIIGHGEAQPTGAEGRVDGIVAARSVRGAIAPDAAPLNAESAFKTYLAHRANILRNARTPPLQEKVHALARAYSGTINEDAALDLLVPKRQPEH